MMRESGKHVNRVLKQKLNARRLRTGLICVIDAKG